MKNLTLFPNVIKTKINKNERRYHKWYLAMKYRKQAESYEGKTILRVLISI
jgi:hypothetical protein